LVVLNTGEDAGRERAQGLLEEVRRLRADRAVFDDVLGWRGSRVPITAVVADLADLAGRRVTQGGGPGEAERPGAGALTAAIAGEEG
jgi:hypothetical protein